MPWFPEFTSAVEQACLQTRAAGHTDPVGQYSGPATPAVPAAPGAAPDCSPATSACPRQPPPVRNAWHAIEAVKPHHCCLRKDDMHPDN
jgi:hypothetical protein